MRAFIDTSVFIWGFSEPESNSAALLELVDEGRLEAVASEKVVEELERYFSLYHDRRSAYSIKQYVKASAKVVPRSLIGEEVKRWASSIKEKDLEHVATVKALGLRYLIAFDRDFESFPEYYTPKKFLKLVGLKPKQTEY